MKLARIAGLLLLAAGSLAARAEVSGSYSGSYELQTRNGVRNVGVKLDVLEVKGENVKAKVLMSANDACSGEYPMAGKLKKAHLTLHSTQKSGRAGDCTFSLSGDFEGDKLVGKTGGGRTLILTK